MEREEAEEKEASRKAEKEEMSIKAYGSNHGNYGEIQREIE